MLTPLIAFTLLAGLLGLGLGWAARRFRVESDPVVDQIDALLPQTQCGQCNYPGCRPYAEAIAADEADIKRAEMTSMCLNTVGGGLGLVLFGWISTKLGSPT